MLAGRVLAGKSTLAAALTRSLVLGIPFLARDTIKCRVGYIGLKRNGEAVARLFEQWGLSSEVYFCDGVAPTGNLDALALALQEQIKEHRLEVVIVDHLQNLARIKDSTDYSQVSLALEPVAGVAKRTACHLLLLHHQGKRSVMA